MRLQHIIFSCSINSISSKKNYNLWIKNHWILLLQTWYVLYPGFWKKIMDCETTSVLQGKKMFHFAQHDLLWWIHSGDRMAEKKFHTTFIKLGK